MRSPAIPNAPPPLPAGQSRPLSILHLHEKRSLSNGSVQQMMQADGGLRARGHSVTAATPPSAEIAEYGTSLGIEAESERFSSLFDLRCIAREAARFVRQNFSIDRRIDRLESICLSAAQPRRSLQRAQTVGESAGYTG